MRLRGARDGIAQPIWGRNDVGVALVRVRSNVRGVAEGADQQKSREGKCKPARRWDQSSMYCTRTWKTSP